MQVALGTEETVEEESNEFDDEGDKKFVSPHRQFHTSFLWIRYELGDQKIWDWTEIVIVDIKDMRSRICSLSVGL